MKVKQVVKGTESHRETCKGKIVVGKILVIDDCEVTRERLWAFFKERFAISLAATAAEGLRLLSEDVGVVILDYVLPDKDGAFVLGEIKASCPSIPVIIITGFGSEEICQRVFRGGAVDYIRKPFGIEEIRAKIDLLLSLRNAASERRHHISLDQPSVVQGEASADIPLDIWKSILAVKRYIDENYMTNLRLQDVSKKAGMNRTYFCRYFKLVTGFSFRDYLKNKRLSVAREHLKDRRLRVSDVADQVGYSPKYFPEVFKRLFGAPPKKSSR